MSRAGVVVPHAVPFVLLLLTDASRHFAEKKRSNKSKSTIVSPRWKSHRDPTSFAMEIRYAVQRVLRKRVADLFRAANGCLLELARKYNR